MISPIRSYFLFLATQFLFISTSSASFPPSTCGRFEERRICGPTCPVTCDTLNSNICCDVRCVVGCFCRDGYMLVSNIGRRRCVPIDECPRPGILEIGNLTVSVVESMKVVVIAVLRINGTAGEISVRYRTREGTAKERLDFIPTSGILVFPDGVSFQTITIGIIDDDIREPEEFFSVVLSEPTNKAAINSRRLDGVRVIIQDDDMRPGYIDVLNSSITVRESVGAVLITLIRIGGVDGLIRMQYRTVDGTALAQTDYVATFGNVIFEEGERRKTVQITIVDDRIMEPTENFQVQFFDPSVAPGVINFRQLNTVLRTVVTILDDDMKPGFIQFELTTINVVESIGLVNITVIRVQGSDGQIRIRYQTIEGTARARSDFVPVTGDIFFNQGETYKVISLTIINDEQRESIESFKLQLFDPSAAPEVINFRPLATRLETSIIILDDDMKPGFIELPNPIITIPENIGTITINVLRVDGQDGEIRIRYRTVDITASGRADYVVNSGELVFAEGETIKPVVITILNDDFRESSENFRFEIFDPSAAPDVINFRGMSRRTSTIITILDDDMKPGYLELEQTNITVKENIESIQVTIVRLGGTDGILQMKYGTKDGTAAVQSDYQPASGDLIFKDGETRKTISIVILNDKVRESPETFYLQIFDITPGSGTINFRSLGTRLSTLITIIDDDLSPGYVEMEETAISVHEDVGTALIYVVRLGGSDGELRIPCKILDLSAVIGLDYRATLTEIVFRDGETRQTISVAIIDDAVRELTETFRIMLLDLRPQIGQLGYRLLGSKLITEVSIIDNDATPGVVEFEQNSLTIREDIGVAEITVLRVDGTDGVLLVKYKAVVGTASNQNDYTIADGELVFQDGVDRMPIRFNVIDDRIKEPDETFSIIIYQPEGVQGRRTLGRRTSLLVTIKDNDNNPGVFEFQSIRLSVPENIRTLSITIIRKDGTDGEVNLQIRTLKGTATEGLDYNLPPITVFFPEGVAEQRINLQIIDDEVKEGDENFLIGLFNPTNGGVLGENKVLTVVILDDDDPCIIRFQRRTGNYRENVGLVEIPVIRENRLDRTVSIRWRTEDHSARAGEDYRGAVNALLIFEPNERVKLIKIAVMDDIQFERNELFDVILFNPSDGALLGSPSRFTIQLFDNDNGGKFHPSLPTVSQVIEISFRLQNIRVRENAGEVRIPITRVGGLSPLTVRIQTKDGSASGGRDYKRTRGPVSFDDGDIEVTIAIRLIDDDLVEPDETFTVELFDPSIGLIPFGLNMVTITIEDDDADFSGRSGSSYDGIKADPQPQEKTVSSASLLTSCPNHLILKTCANSCPPSCSSMLGKVPCSSNPGCIRACFCPEGLVKANETSCIKPSECPRPSHECNKCSGSFPGSLPGSPPGSPSGSYTDLLLGSLTGSLSGSLPGGSSILGRSTPLKVP